MNSLSRFEQFVEGIVEGSFARLMQSRLQPVEIAKRLARVVENEQVISAGKTFVPNDYKVFLSPEDYGIFESSRASWEQELAEYIAGIAREQGLALFGHPVVTLSANRDVAQRQMRIETHLLDRPLSMPAAEAAEISHTQPIDTAALRQAVASLPASLIISSGSLAGESFAIDKPAVLIGRAMDNDLVLEDHLVSRYHAEIRVRGGRFTLRDLKSTNGTSVNGQEITECALNDGDELSVANVMMVFRIGH